MTTVSRMFLLAASLCCAMSSAGTFEMNEDTAYVLHVRRLFSEVLRDAASRKNINLPLIAHRRRILLRELGPPRARQYQSIRVELLAGQPKTIKQVEPQSLADLRYGLERTRRVHGERLTDSRARTLQHMTRLIRDLLHGDEQLLLDYGREVMEEDLIEMMRFAIWSQDKVDDNPFEFFGESDANVFLNRKTFKERFGRLRAELGVSRRKNPEIGRVLAQLRDRAANAVRVIKTLEETASRTLVLVEVPPDMGVLKGLFADDCSSHECLGYPFAPEDRVFLALDENGDPRGGVVVTRVEYDGQPALYVNTLSGAHMDNSDLVAMTLLGLRKLLGPGEKLLLPTARVLENNFNFKNIRAALQQFIALTAPKPIRFYDEDERRLIEQYSFRNYDAVESHKVAHELPDHVLRGLAIDVHLSAGSPYEKFIEKEPLTEREFLDAMIELIESNRLDMAREFWTRAGRAFDEGQHVIDVLTNAAGATRDGWATRARHMLERQGFMPDQIEALVNDPQRFELARLVAPDANAVSLWPRYLGHNRIQSGFPAFRRWLRDLDHAEREKLLHSTLAAMQSYLDASEEEASDKWVSSDLLVRLIDLKTLNERATELRAQHYPWPVLVRAAELLAGIGKDEMLTLPSEAGMNMISIAFTSARTAEEYKGIYLQLRGTTVDAALIARAFGNTLAHFVRLEPTPAQIDFFGEELGAPDLIRALVAWALKPRAQQPEEFLTAVNTLVEFEAKAHRPLVEAAVHARGLEFRNTMPLVEDIGNLRRLAYESGSAAEKQLLTNAMHCVRKFEDLFDLQRSDNDEVLLNVVKHHLDLLGNVFLSTPLEKCGPKSHPFHILARRHIALMNSGSIAEFFGALHDHPLPTTDPSRKLRYGRLNTEEIDRFVALNPSTDQFRRLMLTANEYRGYARRLAPLIQDLPTLERAVAPLRTLDANDTGALRYEFSALIAAVASRPGEQNFLTELALDQLMSRAGLGAHRHEIPSLPGRLLDRFECEDGLIEVKVGTRESI